MELIKEMTNELKKEQDKLDFMYPERTVKKCKLIEMRLLPHIELKRDQVNEMQKALIAEREEFRRLYDNMNQ